VVTSRRKLSKVKAAPAPSPELRKLPPGAPAWQVWIVAAALAVLAFLCYLPALDGEFVNWDDTVYVTDNMHVRDGLTGETAAWAFTSIEQSNWHPLTWLSHAADVSLYGYVDARGHHLTTVILHALNTGLWAVVLWRLTRRLWPSAVVAALFALHPLHVESVAWVAERKDVLSTFFLLLALWAYAAYASRPTAWRYLLVVAAFVASLMSKPMFVTLPCVLLVLDFWPLERLSWRAVAEKLPLLALTVVSCVITYHAQSEGGAVSTDDRLGPDQRMLDAIYGYSMYLIKAVWPWPGTLLPYYPLPTRGGDEIAPALAFGLLLALTLVTCLVLWQRKRRPYLLTGWLLYLGMLVPAIGLFVQVGTQVMADRYAYVPLAGIFVAVVWLVADLVERRSQAVRVATLGGAAAVCAALGWLTWQQQAVWHDSIALWSHVVEAYPRSSHAHMQLGHAHYRMANVLSLSQPDEAAWHQDQAAACYTRAVELEPRNLRALGNMANSLMRAGKWAEAEKEFARLLKIGGVPKEQVLQAYNGLGTVLMHQGKMDEAMAEFRQAAALDPDYFPAALNITELTLEKKDYAEAERLSRRTTERWPELVKGWQQLAVALKAQGKTDAAAEAEAKAADPSRKRIHQIEIPASTPKR
jgi:tetratricopeptide (TPR) repeat protein